MGATPAQIKALKDRAKRRGGSGIGVKGSSGSHFHQGKPQSRRAAAPGSPKSGALARTNPNAIKKQGAVSRAAGALARKAAEKGSAIVRQKASEKLKAMRAGTGQSRRMADSMRSKPGALARGKEYQEPAKVKKPTERDAVGRVMKANPDEKQKGRGPDKAYAGGPYPKEQKPGKKTNDPQGTAMKRARQRYLERQKQDKAQAERDKTKGGLMGGVKKALGGDLIHPDKDKRREARFERGKKIADGAKEVPGKAAGALNRLRKKATEKRDIELGGAGDAAGSEFAGSSGTARLQ